MKKALITIVVFFALTAAWGQTAIDAFNRGEEAFSNGNIDEAIDAFSEAIRIGGLSQNDTAIVYSERGAMYFFKKEYDNAIADFTEAIMYVPNEKELYYSRGVAYEGKKDYIRANADYETALRLDPNDSTVREQLDFLKSTLNMTASSQSFQYLAPLNNNLLKGPVVNFYKAAGAGLIEPVLWAKRERAQLILSKVKVISINNYNDIPLRQVITVKDIEGENAGEYSFFYIDITNGGNDNTFAGDEIFIVWTQGERILSDQANNLIIFNKKDFAGTKGNDCFIDNNIWRVIMLMSHDDGKFKDFYFNWD